MNQFFSELLPVETIKNIVKRLRSFSFDVRVTVLSVVCYVTATLISYLILVNTTYRLHPMLHLSPRFGDSYDGVQDTAGVLAFINSTLHAVERSPLMNSTVIFYHIEYQLEGLSPAPSPSSCLTPSCSEFISHPALSLEQGLYTPFIPLDQPGKKRAVRLQGGTETNTATFARLLSSGWLHSRLHSGLLSASLVHRRSLLAADLVASHSFVFEVGPGGEIFNKRVTAHEVNLGFPSHSLDIVVCASVVLFALFSIFKFVTKINFIFAESIVVYGVFFNALLVYQITIYIMKLRLVSLLRQDGYHLEMQHIHRLSLLYELFTILYFYSVLFIGLESLKILVMTGKFPNFKTGMIAIYRTIFTITRVLAFVGLLKLAVAYAFKTVENVSDLSSPNLALSYLQPVQIHKEPSAISSLLLGMEGIFNSMVTVTLVSIVYVSLTNAHHLE